MKRITESRVRHYLWVAVVCISCPFITPHAEETSEQPTDDEKPREEIIVSVDRLGRPVDINALRLEEARLEIIRTFEIHQIKVEEEAWRLKLRSITKRNNSRFTWGYDAQSDAARIPTAQANFLPINRVRPATVVAFRF